MKLRLTATVLAGLATGILAVAAVAAGLIGVYRNTMEIGAQRGQLLKLSGRNCERDGVAGALRILVGRRTPACSFRTSVVGRDLELAATERLLSGTPRALRPRAYLGLQLRSGGTGKYEMLVYPLQRKVQLIKVTPEKTRYLEVAKDQDVVGGVNKANVLRLRAFNVKSGPDRGLVRLQGFIGSTLVVNGTDHAAGLLKGRFSTVVVGARRNASGLVTSVNAVAVRVPSPY